MIQSTDNLVYKTWMYSSTWMFMCDFQVFCQLFELEKPKSFATLHQSGTEKWWIYDEEWGIIADRKV